MLQESDLIGRTIAGRFTLTDCIGSGGFASVYRGVQDGGRQPRDVAVKIMKRELAQDERFLRRFKLEARAATRLDHPNSVRVLDSGVDGDLAYIAMELLVGEDLCEVLRRERRLGELRAVRLTAEVCQALAVAHERGVVHRDLKPENIMLIADRSADGGERVKVLDFGVAKLVEAPTPPDQPEDALSSVPSAITRVGTVMGTPSYMAPEQAQGEPVDARTDVYACGVLLFQLVTGRLPFDGDTPLAILMQHVHRAAPSPRTVVPTIHPGLEACVLKALEKRPSDRYQSARELERELRALMPSLAAARLPSLPPRPVRGDTPPSMVISPPFLRVGLDTPFPGVDTPSDRAPTLERKAVAASATPQSTEPRPSKGLEYTATPLVVPLPGSAEEHDRPSVARRGVRVSAPEPPASDPRTGTLRSRRDELLAEVARLAKAGEGGGLTHTKTAPQGVPLPPREAEAEAGSESGTGTGTGPEPEAGTGTGTGTGPEAESGTGTGTESEEPSSGVPRLIPMGRRDEVEPEPSSGMPRWIPIAAREERACVEPAGKPRVKKAAERPEAAARVEAAPEGEDKKTSGPMLRASIPTPTILGIVVALVMIVVAYFTSR